MHEKLTVGDVTASPGEFEKGWIEGIELPTTNRIDIPVMAMNGESEGPTLLLFSTQHGIEVQNIGIVHRIMNDEVSPSDLNGQIIGIPVANPLAYMHATYRSWIDNADVGYESVENPNGDPTEQLAHKLWTEGWSQSDLVLNMHANTRSDSLFYANFRATEGRVAEQERMVEAFGLTTIRYEGVTSGPGTSPIAGDDLPPTLRNKAAQHEIPSITTEVISGRWISEPSQKVGVEGILNIMKEFDMLDDEPVPGYDLQSDLGIDIVPCQYTGGEGVNRSKGFLRAKHGGVFHPIKNPGELIHEGETVAKIVNLHGDVVEVVQMVEDGYVWAYPGSRQFATSGSLQTIETGGRVAYVFSHEEEL